MTDSIAILDFGSQYAQLIARRVREAQVYCELFPWDAPEEQIMSIAPKGFILSGGPASVYEPGAPHIQPFILESGLPILGICYGMQALTHALGGQVDPSARREFGYAVLEPIVHGTALDELSTVWMSHGDRITRLPEGFVPLARSGNSPLAAMGDFGRKYFGVQFHPEVNHTLNGKALIHHFALEISGCAPDWTPASIIEESVARIRAQVGDERVLAAVSGGVDSSVAAALVHRAIGDQLAAVFVDTGLMRKDEPGQVIAAFREMLGAELVPVYAAGEYFAALEGVVDPEQKRRIVGEKFIRIFERQAEALGQPPGFVPGVRNAGGMTPPARPRFLVQGTIYPDVVESSAPDRNKADRIKTHHNVGGLPDDMHFELVEPLRYLFKDEVRAVGEALGLPEALVWRQPFPGPGLTVRCLGEVTPERVERLRSADAIFTEELAAAGLLGKGAATSQAFAVLLPVQSVGVMGDQRTYQEVCALRAVATDDFMTADWARIPFEVLAKTANRIVNEVRGINRVVYDITSKPPATIEWE
jgi:GMP synthase (glutamine-hydrolysing)